MGLRLGSSAIYRVNDLRVRAKEFYTRERDVARETASSALRQPLTLRAFRALPCSGAATSGGDCRVAAAACEC